VIDPKAIKPGDEVTVRATVNGMVPRPSGSAKFRVSLPPKLWVWIEAEDIATHTPAPYEWKKGDRARGHEDICYLVEAVHGDWLWVRPPDGTMPYTARASDLTPIPQDGEQ